MRTKTRSDGHDTWTLCEPTTIIASWLTVFVLVVEITKVFYVYLIAYFITSNDHDAKNKNRSLFDKCDA